MSYKKQVESERKMWREIEAPRVDSQRQGCHVEGAPHETRLRYPGGCGFEGQRMLVARLKLIENANLNPETLKPLRPEA